MAKDGYGKDWIIENAIEIMQEYDRMTVRQLHYRLVARGFPNTQRHYKRVVKSTTDARWDGRLDFWDFEDRERDTTGLPANEDTDLDDKIEKAKEQIGAWMDHYSKNRWENQPLYVEVWIEKKALQGVFQSATRSRDVVLAPCKGYPSLTYLNEATSRFDDAEEKGQDVVILYFGDYDPSGEDIPRSIKENLARMGSYITLKRLALTEEMVIEMGLPPAPTKSTDSRSVYWDGLGQVELDAVDPRTLTQMCKDAIDEHFDQDLYDDLMSQEDEERETYKETLVEYVKQMAEDL